MFLLLVVFGEWNYKCSRATQSFWKMPEWLGPICPQCLNILRSSPEVALCLLESQYRELKPHSYFGTQTAELNIHFQKWSLHPSLIPQNQPNCQWGPRKTFMLCQFVTGKNDVTLKWLQTKVTWGGDGRRQKWDGCPVRQDGCGFLTWHRCNYPCHTGSQETGMLSHVSSGAGPQPKRCAWSWATAEHYSLLLKPTHQMQLVEIRARCASWMHKMCELTYLPRSHHH